MAKPQARSTTAEKFEELCDGQRPPLQLTAAAALARASNGSPITLMTRETRSPDLKELATPEVLAFQRSPMVVRGTAKSTTRIKWAAHTVFTISPTASAARMLRNEEFGQATTVEAFRRTGAGLLFHTAAGVDAHDLGVLPVFAETFGKIEVSRDVNGAILELDALQIRDWY